MNTKQLIAAAIIFSAASVAFAQPVEGSTASYGFLGVNNPAAAANDSVITRGKTRAEVVAELKQAQTDGTLQVASFAGFRTPMAGTTKGVAPQAIANK